MAIPLTGAGSLYVRWGRAFAGLDDINATRGGAATARTLSGANLAARVNAIQADYAAGTQLQQPLDGLFGALTAVQQGMGSLATDLKARVSNTLRAMYSIDVLGVPATAPLSALTAVDEVTALKGLIAQMQTAAASINASAPAAGAQTAVGTPNGNAVLVASVKNAQGQLQQYLLPETLVFRCTADSQGSATLGNEPLSVTGQPPVSDVFSHLWPGGSGAAGTVNATDGSKNYPAAGNLLQNSSFETFTTANVPDNWTLLVGVAGTDVFQGSGGYDGVSALQFTGTGAALLDSVAQTFNTTPATTVGGGGTSYALKPDTQYAGSVWIKTSATPTAGVAEFSLVDGTNAVFNDDQAVANLATRTLTNISTTWTNFTFVFRTPAVLPAVTKLRVRLSTAIDSGKSAFFDRLALTPMTPVYTGGPSVAAFSGSSKLILNDAWTVALTNTYGAFAKWLDRMFGLRGQGLVIPFSGSPTIADSLIV